MNFFEQHKGLWQENVPLAEAIILTKMLVSEIEQIDETLSTNKKGLATQKDADKKHLIEMLFEIISILSAYAAKSGDNTLQEHIGYPLSKLQTMRDASLVSVASGVLSIVTEKAEVLTNFNVSAGQHEAFEASIANYKKSLASMRTNTTARKRNNEKITELLKEAMSIKKEQISKLMVPYKKQNLDFYKTYLSTSKVVPYGTRYNNDDETPDAEKPAPTK